MPKKKNILITSLCLVAIPAVMIVLSLISSSGSDCQKYEDIVGEIDVSFSGSTSLNEANNLIQKMGLSSRPQYSDELYFTPSVLGRSDRSNVAEVEQALKSYPEITNVIAHQTYTGPAYNRGRPKVFVDLRFKRDVTQKRIEEILKSEKITEDILIDRGSLMRVSVPAEQTKAFIARFKQEPLVAAAAQATRCVIPGSGD